MSASEPPARRARVLCLGEALVDLVCERHVASMTQADAFVPRAGGGGRQRRHGRRAAPAPRWRWPAGPGPTPGESGCAAALAGAGVDVSLFELVPGRGHAAGLRDRRRRAASRRTPCTATGGRGSRRGDGGAGTPSGRRGGRLRGPVSHLQHARRGRRARADHARSLRGLEHGLPLIFDPNVRLHRWRSAADAAASSNALVPGALLVRVNEAEATLMTGEDDPERAALALVKAGARLVVITLGRRRRDAARRAAGRRRRRAGPGR